MNVKMRLYHLCLSGTYLTLAIPMLEEEEMLKKIEIYVN